MINWGMAYPRQQGGSLNALAQGFQFGQQVQANRRAEEGRNALAAYAVNPSQEGLAGIASYAPDFALQEGQRYRQEAAAAGQQRQADAATVRRLLEQAGNNPTQALSAAQSLGLDVSQIPQPGTPQFEAWRQEQLFIYTALDDLGEEEISGIARELQNAGYEFGTPEFEQAMRGVINNKYASEYVDEQGNTRRRSALELTPPSRQAPPSYSGAVDANQWQEAVRRYGSPEAAASVFAANDMSVAVSSPEQADSLPSGTPITLPDGRMGVVP